MPTTSGVAPAGLFLLNLRSVVPPNPPPGTPVLTLTLSVDSPDNTVAGHATVTFREPPEADPVMCQSHVTGALTYGGPRVMGATTEALVDLTGYPMIVWPPRAGVGPVQLPNLKANIIMNKTLPEGSVAYEYLGNQGQWQRVERQIARFD